MLRLLIMITIIINIVDHCSRLISLKITAYHFNPSPPRQNGRLQMPSILKLIFSVAFSWMKSFVYWLKFRWSLFPRVQLTKIQNWFRSWLGAHQATSHYLKQCWPSSPTDICGTRGWWVNWLASEAVCWNFVHNICICIFLKENLCILIQILLKFVWVPN